MKTMVIPKRKYQPKRFVMFTNRCIEHARWLSMWYSNFKHNHPHTYKNATVDDIYAFMGLLTSSTGSPKLYWAAKKVHKMINS